jgi:hypothetical protein
MMNIKNLIIFLIPTYTVLWVSILKKVETLNFQMKSLSLLSDRLLSQSIEILSRISKVQRDMDEFTIMLDTHLVLPMNFSIDTLYLIKAALILLISSYVIWAYIPGWALLKASSSFFIKKNDFLLKFRDFNKNLYSIRYDEKSKHLDVIVKPLNSEETYRLDEIFQIHRSLPGVYREIKLRAIEKVTQSTQTEAFSDLLSEVQTEAFIPVPRIISELPTSVQGVTLTPEEIVNLVSSVSSIL